MRKERERIPKKVVLTGTDRELFSLISFEERGEGDEHLVLICCNMSSLVAQGAFSIPIII